VSEGLLIAIAVALLVYAAGLGALALAGRRTEAAALARLVPDCLVLARRLVADPRVPLRRKLLLAALVAYLAMPFDLVPDFLPLVGQLDDAILVVLTLRHLLHASGPELIVQHWPGPERTLRALLRLAA
jgi:uncharacterized membrane protein YkvA (DUF1232 family)